MEKKDSRLVSFSVNLGLLLSEASVTDEGAVTLSAREMDLVVAIVQSDLAGYALKSCGVM
jgi:hypothetical protein